MPYLAEHAAEIFQARLYGVAARFDEAALFVALPEREGAGDPPDGDDQEYEHHRRHQRDEGEHFVQNIDADGEQEGNAAADIAPRIAARGDFVHAFGLRYVAEHGIVDDEGELIGGLGEHEQHEEPQPVLHEAQHRAAQRADEDGGGKDLFAHAAEVGQRAQRGAEHRDDGGGNAGGVCPIGEIRRLRNAVRRGDGVEKDGEKGGYEEGERGVADIVPDPFALGRGHLKLHSLPPPAGAVRGSPASFRGRRTSYRRRGKVLPCRPDMRINFPQGIRTPLPRRS